MFFGEYARSLVDGYELEKLATFANENCLFFLIWKRAHSTLLSLGNKNVKQKQRKKKVLNFSQNLHIMNLSVEPSHTK